MKNLTYIHLYLYPYLYLYLWTSLVAQTVKHLPAMRETWFRSQGREDPLEKEMAIHSSTIAWKIPCTEEPGRLQSMGSQSRTQLSDFTFYIYVCAKSLQLCPALCTPTDCSLPGSFVHGILQGRILGVGCMPFSRGSSQPRYRTCISRIDRWVPYH